jgi:hypothetical protein
MHQMSLVEPRPIENGSVPQVLVQYLGDCQGSVRWAPVNTGHEYHFSNQPAECLRWVYQSDEEFFRRLPDFHVLDDRRIDPVADRERERRAELEQMRRAQDELRAELEALRTPSRPKSTVRTGRPKIESALVIEAGHLKLHCEWAHAQIAAFQQVEGANPAATIGARLRRGKASRVWSAGKECPHCNEGWFPPPPE